MNREIGITCVFLDIGGVLLTDGWDHLARRRAAKNFQLEGAEDWIFASPIKLGRLPYSHTGVWRELERAAEAAKVGHIGTHSFRHTHRSWLDAVGTSMAVQQKMMRHADIRTTMNIYGDVVTDEMATAGIKVAQLAFQGNGAQTERDGS
jgi:integrase